MASLLLAAPLSALPVFAQDDAQALIEKMSQSAKTLDYKGYFTFERGNQSSSFYMVHQLVDDKEHQRLVFMDGKPLEIIGNGHSFKCLHPGGKNIQASHGEINTLLNFNKSKAGIWQYYSAEVRAEERVAGRETLQVLLSPLDQHRYPFVFNIDAETGLMVKMLVLDGRGQPLERFHYVNLEFGDVTADDLKPAMENYSVVEHLPYEKTAEDASTLSATWELAWVPGGFVQEEVRMKPWSEQRHQQAFMYSDGVAAFSVFVEESSAANQASVSRQLGSTAAVSHYVNSVDKVYLVTVVGEIPVVTAKQIASAVRMLP